MYAVASIGYRGCSVGNLSGCGKQKAWRAFGAGPSFSELQLRMAAGVH